MGGLETVVGAWLIVGAVLGVSDGLVEGDRVAVVGALEDVGDSVGMLVGNALGFALGLDVGAAVVPVGLVVG